jgi:LacI family transcriptional regulator
LLCHTGRDVQKERAYLNLLRIHRVDGIVWSPTGSAADYPASSLKRFATPLVFIDRVVPTFHSYDSVLLNNHAASFQATTYLLDLGHRTIAMMSGPDFLEPASGRTKGFKDAFRRRGLPVREDLILNGNFREAEAFEQSRKLFAGDEPITAVLVANNPMFIGVMRALNVCGLICPQDVSVASIDDFPLADTLSPHVTTVRQPIREMAEAALRLLLQRLAGETDRAATHLQFQPTLIVRESCAPYRARAPAR